MNRVIFSSDVRQSCLGRLSCCRRETDLWSPLQVGERGEGNAPYCVDNTPLSGINKWPKRPLLRPRHCMIRYRLARPDDIATCVQFIADHPVLGPRYGPAIEHLGTVWRRFLGSDALFSIVSEETGSGKCTRMIGAQIASFVSDDFAAELATPPLKWIGPELVNRCLHGPTPVLTDEEVRQANSTHGPEHPGLANRSARRLRESSGAISRESGCFLRRIPRVQHQAASDASDPSRGNAMARE